MRPHALVSRHVVSHMVNSSEDQQPAMVIIILKQATATQGEHATNAAQGGTAKVETRAKVAARRGTRTTSSGEVWLRPSSRVNAPTARRKAKKQSKDGTSTQHLDARRASKPRSGPGLGVQMDMRTTSACVLQGVLWNGFFRVGRGQDCQVTSTAAPAGLQWEMLPMLYPAVWCSMDAWGGTTDILPVVGPRPGREPGKPLANGNRQFGRVV